MKLFRSFGLLIIIILIIIPLILWVLASPFYLRFINLSATTTSIGQIAGLVGMTLFSLNLILGNRTKFLDDLFSGIDKVYNYHQQIGAIAFSLLLFHPLLLSVKYILVSVNSAAFFLLPSKNTAIDFGIIALFLLMTLMVVTFYIRLKYHIWKFFHKFMVLVFVFAILHSLLITSDISRSIPIKIYILGLAIIALSLGFYRTVLIKLINNKFKYTVKTVRYIEQRIVEVVLSPKDNDVLRFKAGQFIFISFIGRGISDEIHPFSIASSPDSKEIILIVKTLGDYTERLGRLTPGDQALIEGPFGRFSYQNFPSRNQIWIAGGIGITPFFSMAKDLKNKNYNVELFYCVSQKREAVLFNDLLEMSSINSSFKVHLWNSNEKGRINGKIIVNLTKEPEDSDILICGPDAFMQSLKEQLVNLGIKRSNVHTEEFKFK